jgi:CheY-like chemotaxis protein
MGTKAIDILLIDDDPADVLLTTRALEKDSLYETLNVVGNGIEALEYLRFEGVFKDAVRPDLILLDLNMPRMDGREFLHEMKSDEKLKSIPVVVLTTSDSQTDISTVYSLHASCFVTKPSNLGQFNEVVSRIQGFWMGLVNYPSK